MAGIVVGNPRNIRSGLRVLVVDDDPSALLIAERMLTTKQYQVTTASRGGEALSLLENTEGKFDLVLSDLYMPGMDGFQLLKIVREVYNISFLLMSSDHKLDIMERGLEAGARFFFPKPLTMMNYENMWQFVHTENVDYFQGINIKDQGPPPPLPPPHSLLLDRSSTFSISDDIRRQGRSSSSSSNTSNGNKRTQDVDHDNRKKKMLYKNREKEDHDFGKKTAVVPRKKTRVVWTSQLHEKFLHALSVLSMARKSVVPRKILALMKVKGLSRANIGSHLQKYRLNQNKYKGTLESNYPRRRIRMCLPIETEYHDYAPSHDRSVLPDYQNRPQSPFLENQLGVQDNFSTLQVSSARPQYHFQEGSSYNFMAQANYGYPTAITNPGYLERPWMSGAQTMNQSNVGDDANIIGSTINATPTMAVQNAPLNPNFDYLSFESIQSSPPSPDIENMGALGAWSGILTGTIDGEILNIDNSTNITSMDESRKGKKPLEEVEDEFSLLHDPLDFNRMNWNLTSLGEPFAVNPNYGVVGESSTKALVDPKNLQQGNKISNNDWFSSIDDNVDFLLNQGSNENVNKQEVLGYVNPNFNQ